MIDEALQYVGNVLNRHLKNYSNVDSDPVVVNHLIDSGGSSLLSNQNKMVLTLINLELETAKAFYGGQLSGLDMDSMQKIQPAIRFNLDIMMAAHFDIYSEALKFLSLIISFFQSCPSMSRQEFPDMPSSLERLDFEIENMTYEQMNNLWSALGTKYQPSVIYKIRHISFQNDQIRGEAARVQNINSQVFR